MAPAHSPAPATLPKPRPAPADPAGPLAAWLAAVNALLAVAAAAPDPVSEEALAAVFLADGYWRDHLCLSWEYRTAHTLPRIGALLAANRIRSIELSPSHATPSFVAPLDFEGKLPAIFAFIAVTTAVGTGHGMVKLLQDGGGDGPWKAYTVYTALKTLDRYPERVLKNRPHGVAHGAHPARKNWAEQRRDEQELADPQLQPAVLVVGAGHAGLVTAARLKMLGIPALVIDRNERVGDNWRKRYHQLGLIHSRPPTPLGRGREQSGWWADWLTESGEQCCTTPSSTTTCPTSPSPLTGPRTRPRTSWATGSSSTPRPSSSTCGRPPPFRPRPSTSTRARGP